jgi:Glycosyltransferase family 10 (fucosyltransferase).
MMFLQRGAIFLVICTIFVVFETKRIQKSLVEDNTTINITTSSSSGGASTTAASSTTRNNNNNGNSSSYYNHYKNHSVGNSSSITNYADHDHYTRKTNEPSPSLQHQQQEPKQDSPVLLVAPVHQQETTTTTTTTKDSNHTAAAPTNLVVLLNNNVLNNSSNSSTMEKEEEEKDENKEDGIDIVMYNNDTISLLQNDTNSSSSTNFISMVPSTYNVFWCGYENLADSMASCLFDDAQSLQMLSEEEEHLGNNHDVNDILVASYRGPCFAHTSQGTNAPDLFHGQILYVMGEAFPMYPLTVRDRIYALSYLPTDGEKTIRSYFGAMFVSCTLSPDHHSHLFDPTQKVMNSGERFLIYASSHCIRYRDRAFASLSYVGRGPAYYGGTCRGGRFTVNETALLDEDIRSKSWGGNANHLGKYRFALVMENTKQDGYITEKIINAFLAGCVPIYYGTLEVMDIFNPKAFIYYDVYNPQPALDRIAYLESNDTAYMEMLEK